MDTLRIAAGALAAHKLRSFLTLLGVIIGVMTVIAVVSIISGLNSYLAEKVFTLSPDVYIVTKFGIITSREQFLEAVKRKNIDWHDYEAIRQSCTRCAAVGAQETSQLTVKRSRNSMASFRAARDHRRDQQRRRRRGRFSVIRKISTRRWLPSSAPT
jgi:putative ABC transport system permease protein